jgi:hypothetical protein
MQATVPRSSHRFVIPGVWTSGFLLALMLLNLALSLNQAGWAEGMAVLTPVVMGGFLLGAALSLSRFSGLFPVLHSLTVGTVWVLIWVSRAPQIPEELVGAQRIAYMGENLWSWVLLLFSDQPARSNLVFVLELSLLLWWLGYLSAWAVFREGRVWRAIIPIGLVMLVNMYFGPAELRLYFVFFVVTALLLAVRSYLSEQELAWRRQRVRYATDIQFDFLRDGLIFAVLVVALALLTPNAAGSTTLSSTLEPLREPWQQVQAEWGRLFSSLNYQAGTARPAFGSALTLGGPRSLGDTVIMDVRSNAGRYWRAVAYDTYTGRRWLNTSTLIQPVDFGTHVRTPEFQARQTVTQTVTTYYAAGNVLFGAPQPVRVSLKANADLGIVEAVEGGGPPVAEIMMLHRRGQDLKDGESYLVVSELTTADVESLQEAGTDYPDWVRERYLDVPPTVSSRVAELAQEVTKDADNPYDQVVALESYLRGFTYSDDIPAPPPNVDAVDYFLFDVQAGYCDYYASTLAIMARTLGIPARVSAGYNQGEYIPDLGGYRIREYNGHSWPEVFFPGYGWIEFEPTASEEEIVRPRRQDQAQDQVLPPDREESELLEEEERFGDQPELGEDQADLDAAGAADTTSQWWWVGLLGVVLLIAVAAFVLVRPSPARQRRQILDPQLALKLYGRLVQWAERLRLPLLPSQTPHEHAAVLYRAVPEGRAAITSITDLYVHEQYSPRPASERQAEDAVSAWTGLQPLLRRHWIRMRMGPLGRLGARPRRPDDGSHVGDSTDEQGET